MEAGKGVEAQQIWRLQVEQLRVIYSNGAIGVSDVSLKVGAQQIVVLIGANGAGKSTVARAVTGFLRTEGASVTRGRITIDGVNVNNREPFHLSRAGVAGIPERRKIFPNLTVRENLMFLGTRLTRDERQERLGGVHELFPFLAERGRTTAGLMSGGEQQMLAIGRALMGRPRLLVVDEMTLGLHPSIHAVLFGAMRKIRETGTSLLLIDENIGFALEVADYCYMIRSGNVCDAGRPETFGDAAAVATKYLGAA